MKKVAISIPVHENSAVVENQILNFKKFVPNSVVVIHVSADSPQLLNEISRFSSKYNGFLYINPTRYHTFKYDESSQVTGLSTVHASNIKYISSITDFNIMAFNTSNDMFVRKGIEKDFENYLCGCSSKQKNHPDHFPFRELVSDLKKLVDLKTCEKTSQEGFWCPKEAALFFANKIFDLMSIKSARTIPAEEGFLCNLVLNGFPELYNSMVDQYIYHNPAEAATSREMIHKVRNGELPHKFAVKRVPRRINDATRIYINQLTAND